MRPNFFARQAHVEGEQDVSLEVADTLNHQGCDVSVANGARAAHSQVVLEVLIIRGVVAVLVEVTAAADHLTFADWASSHIASDVVQATRGDPAIMAAALESIWRQRIRNAGAVEGTDRTRRGEQHLPITPGANGHATHLPDRRSARCRGAASSVRPN